MSLKGKRILVTGAGGFIGSHLTERIAREAGRCRALVHYNSMGSAGWLDHSDVKKEIEIVAGDITDTEMVRKAVEGCEIVLHLAALIPIPYSYHAPRSYVRTNVEGTLNVLQACRDCDVKRLVHTSTSEVYGTAQFVPIPESHPLNAQSPYAATKIGADQLIQSFVCSFGLPAVILRPFNTFGPRQSLRAVIPSIILQALRGAETVKLGKISPTRDFNFVENTVDGFVRAAETTTGTGHVYNLGTGTEISVGEVVKRVAAIVGREIRIDTDERRMRPEASEVDRLCADITLAGQHLGWTPRRDFDAGLKLTTEWFQRHEKMYRNDSFTL